MVICGYSTLYVSNTFFLNPVHKHQKPLEKILLDGNSAMVTNNQCVFTNDVIRGQGMYSHSKWSGLYSSIVCIMYPHWPYFSFSFSACKYFTLLTKPEFINSKQILNMINGHAHKQTSTHIWTLQILELKW